MTKSADAHYDLIVIGGGAAGLFCAGLVGQQGKRVLLLEHQREVGRKILISGGGRCNFTHLEAGPQHYVSSNPHFCKSALARFTPQDFLKYVQAAHIPYFEKTPGQLFCENSARDIVQLLYRELQRGQVALAVQQTIKTVQKEVSGFSVQTQEQHYTSAQLVIATGGLSMPKIGASGFGYRIAEQFDLKINALAPALDGFVLKQEEQAQWSALSGVSLPVKLQCGRTQFAEPLLFTHWGLSGPAALQGSLYWQAGSHVGIDLAPQDDVLAYLMEAKEQRPKASLKTILGNLWPKRFAEAWLEQQGASTETMGELAKQKLQKLAHAAKHWQFTPARTFGYQRAEVTRGGIDTAQLSSQSMMVKNVPGLYFIGELVDVTGQLGGFNFQWAWASAWACAQDMASST